MPMTYFATIMILRRWSAYRKTSGLRGRNRGNPSTSPLSPGGRGVGGEGDEWRVWLAFWNRQNSRVGCAQRITIRRFAAGLLTFPNWTIKKNERTADNLARPSAGTKGDGTSPLRGGWFFLNGLFF